MEFPRPSSLVQAFTKPYSDPASVLVLDAKTRIPLKELKPSEKMPTTNGLSAKLRAGVEQEGEEKDIH